MERMTVPLATLRRHSQLVWLHDSLGLPPVTAPGHPVPVLGVAAQLDAAHGRRLSFLHAGEAQSWLRHWKSDVAALMSLRTALQRTEPSAPVFSWSDDEVLNKMGERLARRAVVAVESHMPPPPAVLPAAPAGAAIVEPVAVPVSQLLAPAPVPVPPLLPVLEEVQIEGAEVLPEIEQSLEQVEVTIGEIKLAPVTLAPTPSKVPAIETAMGEASASVTSTLDKL